MPFTRLLTTSLLAAVACLPLNLPSAVAGEVEKAFRISGEGLGPEGLPLPGQPPRPHWIIGHATHLGMHYSAGAVQTDNVFPTFDRNGRQPRSGGAV